MSDDLLQQATRALRDSPDASELEARAARARVMSGLHQSRVTKRTRVAFLLPIAATFLAASAWGAASGNARRALESVERWAGVSAPAPTPKAQPQPRVSAPPAALPQAPASEALPPAPVVETALVPAAPSASTPRREAADPALALYRVAHHAHFVEHDAAAAVAAWDAYLAAAPKGQFAPEARYNRALGLVRLGRSAEARTALEPFANGRFGSYRQAEAAALLERLAD